MALAKVEFAVRMTCQKCVNAIRESITDVEGIKDIDISLERGTVIVETNLPYSVIQERIERTGRQAVLKGYGDESSAVSMLDGNSGYSVGNLVKGVVRFAQTSEGCIMDGTIDGLAPGEHGIHVHECGDISNGCDSVGEHFNPNNSLHGGPDDDLSKRHVGDLGNIQADATGRATFRKIDAFLKIPDIIGRSLIITEHPDDLGKGDNLESKINGNSGRRYMEQLLLLYSTWHLNNGFTHVARSKCLNSLETFVFEFGQLKLLELKIIGPSVRLIYDADGFDYSNRLYIGKN